MSGRRKWILALILFSAVLAAALVGIALVLWDYHASESAYESMREEYLRLESTQQDEPEDTGTEKDIRENEKKTKNVSELKSCIFVDLKGLQKLNPDIIGWIYQENGEISYPVMYSGDNETYLRKMPDKSDAIAGSIFLEGKNRPEMDERHLVIYGHNMRNGSMFGRLKAYRDEDYLSTHRFFQLYTKDGLRRYEIFAWQRTKADDPVYQVGFDGKKDYARWLKQIKSRADYCTDRAVALSDQVLTLSTCSGTGERLVIHGVRVYSQQKGRK